MAKKEKTDAVTVPVVAEKNEVHLTVNSNFKTPGAGKGSVLRVISRFEDIAVKHAKLTKAYTVECAYIDAHKDRRNEIIQKSDAIAHEDLRLAFRSLRIHLAKLCDLREAFGLDFDEYEQTQMIKEKPKDFLDALSDIEVSGFSISGGDDGEGVTLTGTKRIGNKVLVLNSPFTKFDDVDYIHSDSLQMYVLYVADEVKEYLNGKAAMKQLDMFEETAEESSTASGF